MKTAIIYYSKHHENTKKLLDAIREAHPDDVTLIDVLAADAADLMEYDAVGFASGIYYSKFEKRVISFARDFLPEGQDVFFIYTCGSKRDGYTKSIREALKGKNANILGEYGCLGYDTFGPFKLIGGIAKKHPDSEEIQEAVSFYNHLSR